MAMLFLDFDDGFKSVYNARNAKGELIISEEERKKIIVIPFHKERIVPLTFVTDLKTSTAPAFAGEAVKLMNKYNTIINQLGIDGTYEKQPIKTLVIDSLTSVIRVWKEAVLSVNSIPSLRIPDFGTLEHVLFNQFIQALKTLINIGMVRYVVVIDHIVSEKDEVTGAITEFPLATSVAQGKVLGNAVDDIWLQREEGVGNFVWRTRKAGLFQAGSRLHLPDPLKADFKVLEEYMKKVNPTANPVVHPMLVIVVGIYKTGKTISACTFPKE